MRCPVLLVWAPEPASWGWGPPSTDLRVAHVRPLGDVRERSWAGSLSGLTLQIDAHDPPRRAGTVQLLLDGNYLFGHLCILLLLV